MVVRSIVAGFAVMRHLAATGPQGVSDIARALDMNPSSCFNVAKTLVQEQVVVFDAKTKKYALDPLPAQFFSAAPRMNEWFSWLRTELNRLSQEYLLTSGLWQVRGNRLVLVDVIDSPDPTRVHLASGQRAPLYVGAMGRCIAAVENRSREAIPKIISKSRWQNCPTAQAYWDDMEHVRAEGWSVDRSHFVRGLTTIASPVRGREQSVRYCLSGTAFTDQHDQRQVARIGQSMARIGRAAEQKWEAIASGG